MYDRTFISVPIQYYMAKSAMEETFYFWLCLWHYCYSVQPGLRRGVNSENNVEGDGFDGNSVSGEIREGSAGDEVEGGEVGVQ
jgi:hypothetical protein